MRLRPLPGRRGAGRVGLAYATLFTVNAAGLAWLPVWLAGRGLSGGAIGLVIAASMAARFVVTPVAGYWADAARPRAVLVAAGGALLVAHALFFIAQPLWAYAAIAILMGAGMGPAVPVLEITNVRLAQQGGPAFGPMRAIGSLAFIATTVALGGLVADRGAGVVMAWLVAGSAAFLAAAALLPVPRAAAAPRRPREPTLPALASPPMLLALLASGLIQSSHAFYYGFASLLWLGQGLPDWAVGALWAWGAGVEVLVLWFARRLEPLGAAGLLALGAACAVARWTLMGFAPGLAGLVLLQALHAGTFSVAHLGFTLFVRDHAAPHVAATAQSVNSAITFGAGLAAATALSGVLYERVGAAGYFVMAGLAAAGLAAAATLRTRLAAAEP